MPPPARPPCRLTRLATPPRAPAVTGGTVAVRGRPWHVDWQPAAAALPSWSRDPSFPSPTEVGGGGWAGDPGWEAQEP